MDAHDLTGACQRELSQYPLYSQEQNDNPMVGVKLFNAFGAGTWYLTEYDPSNQIAFGYVTGLTCDEWGYVSLAELAAVRFGTGIPAIEVDLYFSHGPFKEVRGK